MNVNIINQEKLCPLGRQRIQRLKQAGTSALAVVKFHKPFCSGFGRTQNAFAKFSPHYLKPHVQRRGFHAYATSVFINIFY